MKMAVMGIDEVVVVGYGTSAPTGDAEQQQKLFLRRFPHLRDQRLVLFLSRIHPKKGVDLLIEAFAAVAPMDPRLQLVIAGPDQVGWQAQLQQRAAALGIAERITWPGMLGGDLKWGAFRAAELFCLPSHQENFGVVVAEALACGLPVAIAEHVNISAEVSARIMELPKRRGDRVRTGDLIMRLDDRDLKAQAKKKQGGAGGARGTELASHRESTETKAWFAAQEVEVDARGHLDQCGVGCRPAGGVECRLEGGSVRVTRNGQVL